MHKFHRLLGPLRNDNDLLKQIVTQGGLCFLPEDLRDNPEFVAVANKAASSL